LTPGASRSILAAAFAPRRSVLAAALAPRRSVLAAAFARRVAASLLAALGVASCLPNDTRVPPGSVLVTLESDGVAASGLSGDETSDGWSISFDRVLVALGNVSLDGDGCNVYSDAGYSRIFDLKTPGEQKVSILYALGRCDVGFRVGSPNADTLLTDGVTEVDKTMMRTPESDMFAQQSGTGIYVRGHAERGDTTKSFEWSFRLRARYERCTGATDAGAGVGVELPSKSARTLNLVASPAVLFADDLDVLHAHPRFQVFADADTFGDDDGVVTLDELAHVPATLAGFGVSFGDGGARPALDASYLSAVTGIKEAASSEATLADYVYLVLFPAVVRYQGDGTCSVDLADRGLGS